MIDTNLEVAKDSAMIGTGCKLDGKLEVPDILIVEGEISGDVQARYIKVGTTGFVSGNISATEADVAGTVSKSVIVRQLLTVRSTGRIEGEVTYGQLELEKGAVIAGSFASSEARGNNEVRGDLRAVREVPQKPEKNLRLSYDVSKVEAG